MYATKLKMNVVQYKSQKCTLEDGPDCYYISKKPNIKALSEYKGTESIEKLYR